MSKKPKEPRFDGYQPRASAEDKKRGFQPSGSGTNKPSNPPGASPLRPPPK